jgi:translation initiation factor IF-1
MGCGELAAPRVWRCVLDTGLRARVRGHSDPGGRKSLARDDLIQATGSVDKILGGGRYQITLESGQVVTAQLSGRMRRFRIRVIPGDRVTVGLSPYDPTHGFITFRLREGQNAP